MSRPRDDLVSSNHELYEKTELNDGENKKMRHFKHRAYVHVRHVKKQKQPDNNSQSRAGGRVKQLENPFAPAENPRALSVT